MVTEVEIPIEKRIFRLLEHLGINKAPLAARVPRDWPAFAETHPPICSITDPSLSPAIRQSIFKVPWFPFIAGDRGPG